MPYLCPSPIESSVTGSSWNPLWALPTPRGLGNLDLPSWSIKCCLRTQCANQYHVSRPLGHVLQDISTGFHTLPIYISGIPHYQWSEFLSDSWRPSSNLTSKQKWLAYAFPVLSSCRGLRSLRATQLWHTLPGTEYKLIAFGFWMYVSETQH